VALLAGMPLSCATNPVTGEKQLSLVSEQQEIGLGKETAEEVQQSIGLYPDPRVAAYVDGIGKRMAASSERPNLPWQFQVVDDDAVNAFALPGGPVYVTRGLLTHLNSEAELAAVLGHETAHITAKHSVNQLSKAQLAQLGLGLGAALKPSWAKYGQLAGAGLQIMFLRFSRDHEREADDLGFKYMQAQGYDPHAMVTTFQTLDRVSQSGEGGRLPAWLATHPDPGDRVAAAQRRIETQQAAAQPGSGTGGAGQAVKRDEYLAAIDGMTFGPDPRQGYFKGRSFFHPEMRFRMDFPEGWKTLNTHQAVGAVAPAKDGVVQLGMAKVGLSPDAALKEFLAKEGVQAATATPLQIAGQPALTSGFTAKTDQGEEVSGVVAFFTHGGRTLGALALAPKDKATAHEAAFRGTLESFQALNDPAALNVQPARVQLVTVPSEMTVDAFNARFPSTVPVEQVALINGVERNGTFKAGQKAKRVIGGMGPSGG